MSNLRNFDLNLLLAFDVLMQVRNVTRAAERMFITQSAMSHTLHRLRQQLDDPLLVKTPSGMQPTERAMALVGPVRSLCYWKWKDYWNRRKPSIRHLASAALRSPLPITWNSCCSLIYPV